MKTKIALLILVVAGIAFYGCASSSSPLTPTLVGFTPKEDFSYAVMEYDSKDMVAQYNPDGTITMFSTGSVQVKILPVNMTNSRGTRGALTRTPDEFNALVKQYEANLADNPQDFDACIMLAGLYIDRGNPGDADIAVKYSDQALSIRDDDVEALYARGIAYNEKGDSPDQALEDLNKVLQSNIQSMKGVYYVMGMINYKENKVDDAILAFEKVRALDPGFVDTDEILEVLYGMVK